MKTLHYLYWFQDFWTPQKSGNQEKSGKLSCLITSTEYHFDDVIPEVMLTEWITKIKTEGTKYQYSWCFFLSLSSSTSVMNGALKRQFIACPWGQDMCFWNGQSPTLVVRRAGLLWSQRDFEWRWSVRLFKCLTVLEFSFILFDLCLLITFFNFIMNYVPIVTFWIFTYHKIWILSIMFCFIWSYWIICFLACL